MNECQLRILGLKQNCSPDQANLGLGLNIAIKITTWW